jgi:hypothetical protein
MKKNLSYLLLLGLLVIFVSACSSRDKETTATSETKYLEDYLFIANAGNEQVTLDWLIDPKADTYNIYYIEDDGTNTRPSYSTMQANGTKIVGAEMDPLIISAPYTITGLTNDKRYWFSISGVNSSGESYLWLPTFATPKALPPPAAPEDVRANSGNEKVTVTWTPVPYVNGVADVEGYVVYCYWQEGPNAGSGTIAISGQDSHEQVVGPNLDNSYRRRNNPSHNWKDLLLLCISRECRR